MLLEEMKIFEYYAQVKSQSLKFSVNGHFWISTHAKICIIYLTKRR